MDLTPHGLDGYKVDREGTVYGRTGKPLQFQYTGGGFKAVPLSGNKIKRGMRRIDRLIGAAFHNISLDDHAVEPVYRDGDTNNVTLDNLYFVRK